MVISGSINREFKGVIVYRGNMNINPTDLQAGVASLVEKFPGATVVGIVSNNVNGNEVDFQHVT